ncbi:MAG: hypothetical protein WC511_00925 [Candidatus Pacearchaeota archaeon]
MIGENNPNPFEPPITRKKVQNGFKNECKQRREEIENLVLNIGFMNSRKRYKSLANHYQVSERMIYKDFKWIKGHIKLDNIEELKIDLKVARDKILSESLNVLASITNPDEKLKAILTAITASKHITEQLEIWGIKQKAEDISLSEGIPVNKKTFETYQNIVNKYFELSKKTFEGKEEIRKILGDKLEPELANNIFKEIKEKIFIPGLTQVLPIKDKDGFIEGTLSLSIVDSKDEIKEDEN